MSLAALAPSFNCAAKFFRFPGSIWSESKSEKKSWQEESERNAVERCGRVWKREGGLGGGGS
jgi:hypothetical protein